MATLKVEIVSAAGTSSKTITFSGADATRILSGFQARVRWGGTQDDLAQHLATMAQDLFKKWVVERETVQASPPDIT